MILVPHRQASNRPVWRILTTALALAWVGFVLGETTAQERTKKEGHEVAEPGQNVELRGHGVYLRIREYAAADVDGNDKVSRLERTAFLLALAMQSSEAVIQEYPAADTENDGKLSIIEALELVQGNRARNDLKRRAKLELEAAKEEPLDEAQVKELKAEHRRAHIGLASRVIDVQEWLLDNMTDEPSAETVAELAEFVSRIDRAAFLEKNPEADADGDGTVTWEERAAYTESRWERKLAGIREEIEQIRGKFDDLDLNPGQIQELEARLERLNGMEAEYAGAIKSLREGRR